MTKRVFNFSAGPATLPLPVLEEARDELLGWEGRGYSIMEASHRNKGFVAVAEQAENDLRELLDIPSNYKVLFMHGGGRGQFASIPMNLFGDKPSADYIKMGIWSRLAIAEARRHGQVNVIADTEQEGFISIPKVKDWKLDPNAAFVHIVDNETVNGVEFPETPDVEGIPLVSDMSSNILSRPIDVKRFGCIYAGAQKNIGPSGLAIVILRDDLLGKAKEYTPTILNYSIQADKGSMLNTPPTFAWYLAGLVFKWIKKEGGVVAMGDHNQKKSDLLYKHIDENDFYTNPIIKNYRSRMNVIFFTPSKDLDKLFIEEAEKNALVALSGHRDRGGIRASIYNAMPYAGVEALVSFMQEFAKKHG